MDVRLHARNTPIDDRFRRAVADKVSRAGKVFDTGGTVDVEIAEERNPRRSDDKYRVEITGSFGGRLVRIATSAASPDAALDDAVDRFAKRLRRLKEKLIDSHRKSEAVASAPPEDKNLEEDVFRVKQFVMKPMTIEEATLQMEMLGHDFFFFLNRSNDKQSVLYRRRDGRLGLIEPA
ncbi:MAG: ribosome-associated translation inhibitor RaiA [Acidimicrobiia bacterium]|nr:ribosome-associated translation inhibitor RaiA [Acidimicrobiia bacterium]MDH5616887.1 ribosome-associated translation inhibitor RaiA [Acidimicrobiia bacterium]